MTHEHEKHNMAIKVTNAINQHLILTKRLKDSLNVDELGLSLDVVNELKQVRSFIEQLPVKEHEAISHNAANVLEDCDPDKVYHVPDEWSDQEADVDTEEYIPMR